MFVTRRRHKKIALQIAPQRDFQVWWIISRPAHERGEKGASARHRPSVCDTCTGHGRAIGANWQNDSALLGLPLRPFDDATTALWRCHYGPLTSSLGPFDKLNKALSFCQLGLKGKRGDVNLFLKRWWRGVCRYWVMVLLWLFVCQASLAFARKNCGLCSLMSCEKG